MFTRRRSLPAWLHQKEKRLRRFVPTINLLQLIDWVKEHCYTHVGIESTGVFWKPIVNLLDAEEVQYLVVNSQHMKAFPVERQM